MAGKKAGPGEIGHNSGASNPLTDDEIHALTLQHKKKYEHALAAKKKTAAELLNVTKLIKSELGDAGLKDIKEMLEAENDEDYEAKVQAELERKARLAKWLGLSVGAQASLFDTGTTKPDSMERASNEGKRAGLAGELLKPPYDGGTEAYHAYVKAWHEGQAANLSMIKKKDVEEVPLIVNPDREDSTVDEFDEAAGGESFGDDAEVDDDAGEGETPWPDDLSASSREPAEQL